MEHRTIRATPATLVDALDALEASAPEGREPFGVLVVGVDHEGLGGLDQIAWSHRSLLVRSCVGVAVVVADGDTRARVASSAGLVPFPLTAVADEDVALGWLAGQHAVGLHGIRPAGGGRTVAVTPALDDYLLAHLSPGSDPVAADLARRTAARFGTGAAMNIGEDQGRLLRLLVEISGARRVIEVGTFTGMSALWLARGLPSGGTLTCFEIDPECIEIARPAWSAAGVADRISVVIGPAAAGLAALPEEPSIDLAFVDADKPGYAGYVEALLPRLAPAGLIVIDNTLWGGAVAHPAADDESTRALRALNDDLAGRVDLEVVILPVGDGLTIVRRVR
jgi:caffeoyl-CoA O-methyltransferase